MPCIKEQDILGDYYDFCDFLEHIDGRFTPYLLHIMFAPAAIIIFLTIIDRCSEDAKYFMLNTAVINIITGIAWEMKRSNGFRKYSSHINNVWMIGKDLSQYSIFLLAVTRVLIFYCPHVYKKVFARKFLFVWIIASDAVLTGLSYSIYGFGLDMNILYTALEVFMLFGTFSCSLFVLTKIRKMQKLVGHVSQKGTFNDLKRASFVCLFQASSYTIYSILLIYMRLYAMSIISMEDSTPLILRILLHAFTELQNPMFLLFAIIDTVIPMILLRSYRRTIRYLCLKPYRMVVGRKTMSVIVSTDLTPRINNLVK